MESVLGEWWCWWWNSLLLSRFPSGCISFRLVFACVGHCFNWLLPLIFLSLSLSLSAFFLCPLSLSGHLAEEGEAPSTRAKAHSFQYWFSAWVTEDWNCELVNCNWTFEYQSGLFEFWAEMPVWISYKQFNFKFSPLQKTLKKRYNFKSKWHICWIWRWNWSSPDYELLSNLDISKARRLEDWWGN